MLVLAAGIACAGTAIAADAASDSDAPTDEVVVKSLRNTTARVAPDGDALKKVQAQGAQVWVEGGLS